MSKDETEMVAVMLPKSDAEQWAELDSTRGRLTWDLTKACRKALRPRLPSAEQIDHLTALTGECEYISRREKEALDDAILYLKWRREEEGGE